MVIFVTILQLISALILIAVVLFQSGKSQGLSGAIGGIADSYLSKSKAKSVDAKLAKATKWVGAVFVVLTLVLNCMVFAPNRVFVRAVRAQIHSLRAKCFLRRTRRKKRIGSFSRLPSLELCEALPPRKVNAFEDDDFTPPCACPETPPRSGRACIPSRLAPAAARRGTPPAPARLPR